MNANCIAIFHENRGALKHFNYEQKLLEEDIKLSYVDTINEDLIKEHNLVIIFIEIFWKEHILVEDTLISKIKIYWILLKIIKIKNLLFFHIQLWQRI